MSGYAAGMADEPAAYVRATLCHGCHGEGHIQRPIATASGETAVQLSKCQWCGGTGRLRGLVPPE